MKILNSKLLSRRTFLRAGGVTLGLPLLDAMLPAGARADQKSEVLKPKRLLINVRALGSNQHWFFPKQTGLDYEATRYTKIIDKYRGRFTTFSGFSHLGYPNSHHSEAGLLTSLEPSAIEREDAIRATVSLDQLVASRIGDATRFPYLFMGTHNTGSLAGLSYTADGVVVPGGANPQTFFKRLFIDSKPEDVEREVRRLDDGKSILDGVNDQLKLLRKGLGAGDRARLDLFESSIRGAERQLLQNKVWARKPKPEVDREIKDYASPNWSSLQRMYYDLAFLAIQTDSTRTILIRESEGGGGAAPGASIGQHDASHHGQDPEKIEQFALYEEEEFRNFKKLLDALDSVDEGNGTLLDQSVVLWASNLGDPSPHESKNLPVMVAGGGFKHRGHVAHDWESNTPLGNLYVRLLQQMGFADEKFGVSTGVVTEI